MFGLGMGELIVIAFIVFFLFGSKKLPELGKGIGEAIREFKKAGHDLPKDVPDVAGKDSSKISNNKESINFKV